MIDLSDTLKQAMTKRERQRSLDGRWPVADPAPAIISLLHMLHVTLSEGGDSQGGVHLDKATRQRLLQGLAEILEPWSAREDLVELRELLGVRRQRGRRRTQRTVNREYGIAFAAYELTAGRGMRVADAVRQIAAEAHVDEKTVRRAMDRWAIVERTVKVAHEHFPNSRIDYSSMLDTK